jgi:hypothetical protein
MIQSFFWRYCSRNCVSLSSLIIVHPTRRPLWTKCSSLDREARIAALALRQPQTVGRLSGRRRPDPQRPGDAGKPIEGRERSRMVWTENASQDCERLNVIGLGFLDAPFARHDIGDKGVVIGDDWVVPTERVVIDGDGFPKQGAVHVSGAREDSEVRLFPDGGGEKDVFQDRIVCLLACLRRGQESQDGEQACENAWTSSASYAA